MEANEIINSDSQVKDFIAEAITLVGGVSELAKIAGVSERTVYAWKNGERHPSRTNLNRLTEHLELATDSSWMQRAPEPTWRELHERIKEPWIPEASPRLPTIDDFFFVKKALARPSAGGGSLETSDEPSDNYAFRLDWLLRKTADTTRLKIMEVMGRSMEQTLHNGDLCLVNENDKHLAEDRIYVIRVHDEIYVKRFSRAPGRYLFRGDNRELSYQDIEIIVEDESLNWEVIGRVIWAGKEF